MQELCVVRPSWSAAGLKVMEYVYVNWYMTVTFECPDIGHVWVTRMWGWYEVTVWADVIVVTAGSGMFSDA